MFLPGAFLWKFSSTYSNNDNFKRKSPGRNNHNAAKLHEKYNNLAREALSSGDKILSENYFQHADHFKRILNEQANLRKTKLNDVNNLDGKKVEIDNDKEKDNNLSIEKIQPEAN